jgi:hypothetical protein
MYHARSPFTLTESSVTVLLSPSDALVADVFRALGDFESHYDLAALDDIERRLAMRVDALSAKSIVSDALLLGFALRTERTGEWKMRAVGDRRATDDEHRLLLLLSASRAGDADLAARAAAALDVRLTATIASLSRDIGRRLADADLLPSQPDERFLPERDDVFDIEPVALEGMIRRAAGD